MLFWLIFGHVRNTFVVVIVVVDTREPWVDSSPCLPSVCYLKNIPEMLLLDKHYEVNLENAVSFLWRVSMYVKGSVTL